ncbi:hypothetical protein DMP23_09470 [Amycolatopsis sp. A1MSW2902]
MVLPLAAHGVRQDGRDREWEDRCGCSREMTGPKGMCATRRLKSGGGERPSPPGRRSGRVKLGAA